LGKTKPRFFVFEMRCRSHFINTAFPAATGASTAGNAVNHERAKENRLNGFLSSRTFRTRLKPGVNEKFSTKPFRECFSSCGCKYF
jgi:hypothetical protein